MGIRFSCPNGHKLNVKTFLAGKRGVCPQCGAKFVIPAPAEAVPSEIPQTIGVGRSQSVEIAMAPTATHVVSPVASPSIIIPVTDTVASSFDLEVEPGHTDIPESVPAAIPPAAIGDLPPIIPAPPAAPSPAADVIRRDRNRRKQIAISVVLLTLVLVLGGMLIWVLQRDAGQAPNEQAPPSESAN